MHKILHFVCCIITILTQFYNVYIQNFIKCQRKVVLYHLHILHITIPHQKLHLENIHQTQMLPNPPQYTIQDRVLFVAYPFKRRVKLLLTVEL